MNDCLEKTGNNNTADGFQALDSNTTGNANIALVYKAGASLTTADNNIDIANQGVVGEGGTIRLGAPGIHTAGTLPFHELQLVARV